MHREQSTRTNTRLTHKCTINIMFKSRAHTTAHAPWSRAVRVQSANGGVNATASANSVTMTSTSGVIARITVQATGVHAARQIGSATTIVSVATKCLRIMKINLLNCVCQFVRCKSTYMNLTRLKMHKSHSLKDFGS